MIRTPPTITANQLWAWISTERSQIITCISFASLRAGSEDRCRTIAILTLGSRSHSSWEYPSVPTEPVNSHIVKVGSSVVCLSMMELQSFLEQYGQQAQRYGYAQPDLISVLTTSIQTLESGYDDQLYSMILCSGESTNIELLLEALGLTVWLLFWKTCLALWHRPEDWAFQHISEHNRTMTLEDLKIPIQSSSKLSMEYEGSMIYMMLKNSYWTT